MPPRDPTVILNAVIAEEPDGYRGQRRRFLVGRRRGGVLLPGLLVAASVLVVLIVVGVSQLLPRDANGQIPLGGGANNANAATDNGQPQPDASDPGSPQASATASRSASPKPSVSPSGGVLPAPVQPGAPQPVPVPAPQPTGSPSSMTPVSVEAEKATLAGGAAAWSCKTCSGGAKVRQVGGSANGSVTVQIPNVPRAGTYQMTITYELGEATRTFYVGVNGAAGTPYAVSSNITDWNTPLTATIQVTLRAGTNTVRFDNPTAPAPDLDRVAVK